MRSGGRGLGIDRDESNGYMSVPSCCDEEMVVLVFGSIILC